jgi:exosome complex component RRP43
LRRHVDSFSENYIDLEVLCIEPEQAVWVLYADILCMNHDGNILDACQLALLAALKNGKSIDRYTIQ